MHVLRLKKEIPGYICDRLQEALWREALHCPQQGRRHDRRHRRCDRLFGRPALGLHGIVPHLSSGRRPRRHARLHHASSIRRLELPWTDLGFPKWSDKLERRLVEGCEAQAAGRSVAEIEAKRNEVLVDLLRLLKQHRIGAGLALRARRRPRRKPRPVKRWKAGAKIAAPIKSWKGTVRRGLPRL